MMTTNTSMLRRKLLQRGESLIEVLVAVLIMGLVMTSVIALMTTSLERSAQVKYQELATTKAQEIIDLVRHERNNQSWATFVQTFPEDSYCFTGNLKNLSQAPCQTSETFLNTSFKREVTFTHLSGSSALDVEVTVSWFRSTKDGTWPSVTLKQRLTQWQE